MKYILAVLIVLISAAAAWPLERPKTPSHDPMVEQPVFCGSFIGRLRAYDTNSNPADGAELAVYGVEDDTVYIYYGPGETGALERIVVVLANGSLREFKSLSEAAAVYSSVCDALAAGLKTKI